MQPITYENLRLFIKSREGKIFKTLSKGKEFFVFLIDSGFKYLPLSTGKPRNYSESSIKQILQRFQEIKSYKPGDYRDISRNASYLLSIIKSYFDSDYSFQTQGALQALYVGGFKAFAETQRIPLKKLTLIYGGNSSGKSSIIHSLLLANHALKTGDFDVHYPILSGESVDLGGFNNYIHYYEKSDDESSDQEDSKFKQYKRHLPDYRFPYSSDSDAFSSADLLDKICRMGPWGEFEKGVNWGFEIPVSSLPRNIQDIFNGGSILKVFININRKIFEKRYRNATEDPVDLPILEDIEKPRVCKYKILMDNEVILSMELPWMGELLLFDLDNAQADLFTGVIEDAFSEFCDRDIEIDLVDTVNEVLRDIGVRTDYFIPKDLNPLTEDEVRSIHFLTSYSHHRKPMGSRVDEEIKVHIRAKIINILNDLLDAISEIIIERIGAFSYLGPLRAYSPREMQFEHQKHLDRNWLGGGTYIWEILRLKKEVREAVNRWLGADKMQTRYKFIKREYIPIESGNIEELSYLLIEDIGIELVEYFKKKKKIDFADLKSALQYAIQTKECDGVADWLKKIFEPKDQAISLLGQLRTEDKKSDLALIDMRSKIEVSHRDVGLGISQVIPVLGLSYASKDRIIAIEQPEIHLHPALQAELADVFIESALGERKNTFLLESHSEHLLLRIMRRMRETFEGHLPEGSLPITPDDVAVLFVEPDGPRSIVYEMPLNERGELVKAWPGGFFEEGLREVFPEDAS